MFTLEQLFVASSDTVGPERGATVWQPPHVDRSAGFVVGGASGIDETILGTSIDAGSVVAGLARFLWDRGHLLEGRPTLGVGLWYEVPEGSDVGQVVVDAVSCHRWANDAADVAVRRGQRAVFDIANEEVVTTASLSLRV